MLGLTSVPIKGLNQIDFFVFGGNAPAIYYFGKHYD